MQFQLESLWLGLPILKEIRHITNNKMMHLMVFEKEELTKHKTSRWKERIKIRREIMQYKQ
jgi:hypothetical protein